MNPFDMTQSRLYRKIKMGHDRDPVLYQVKNALACYRAGNIRAYRIRLRLAQLKRHDEIIG